MATSDEQKEEIRVLVGIGKLSNVQIAKEVGVNEKTVRNLINKEGLKKSEITDLAKREVQNIIIANEIKSEKSEQSPRMSEAYIGVFIDMKEALGVFNNAALQNQALIDLANNQIKEIVKDTPDAILDLMPQVIMASKGTEQNRKQVVGNTETYIAKEDGNNGIVEVEIE